MSAEGATAADGSAGLVARSRLWLLCLLLCTGQAEFESGLPLSLATGQQLLSDVAVTLVAMGGSVVASAVSVQLAKLVATSVCVTVGYLLLRRERLSAPTRGPNLPVTPSTSAAATCQHTTRRIAGAERAGGKLCVGVDVVVVEGLMSFTRASPSVCTPCSVAGSRRGRQVVVVGGAKSRGGGGRPGAAYQTMGRVLVPHPHPSPILLAIRWRRQSCHVFDSTNHPLRFSCAGWP